MTIRKQIQNDVFVFLYQEFVIDVSYDIGMKIKLKNDIEIKMVSANNLVKKQNYFEKQ